MNTILLRTGFLVAIACLLAAPAALAQSEASADQQLELSDEQRKAISEIRTELNKDLQQIRSEYDNPSQRREAMRKRLKEADQAIKAILPEDQHAAYEARKQERIRERKEELRQKRRQRIRERRAQEDEGSDSPEGER
jgi:hypothetical protein